MDAKKYNNVKLIIGISKGFSTFILLFLFVSYGYSEFVVSYIESLTSNKYLLLLLFIFIVGVASTIIFAPVNYYTDFYLEHKYNLSNQTLKKWLWENLKGVMVGIVIGVPILLLFYYVLQTFGELWWLPFSIALFFISVVLAKIVPIIILPIFYKVTPIENEDLKRKIETLAVAVKMKIENVFKFNMSKNTKKANAAFTGLGKTKKVILGDTLLENFSNDQIETVLAHEFGHYKHNHIVKNITIGTFFSFFSLYLMALLFDTSLSWFGFISRTEIAALPILALWGMVIGIIQTPISNFISRKFEYQADNFAVMATNKKDIFISTLEKLTDQNLGDREPHPIVEWFFYSHPSIKNRINYINSIEKNM
jgi:STE24 endopeptidase